MNSAPSIRANINAVRLSVVMESSGAVPGPELRSPWSYGHPYQCFDSTAGLNKTGSQGPPLLENPQTPRCCRRQMKRLAESVQLVRHGDKPVWVCRRTVRPCNRRIILAIDWGWGWGMVSHCDFVGGESPGEKRKKRAERPAADQRLKLSPRTLPGLQ